MTRTAAILRAVRNLRVSWAEWAMHDFRVSQAHQDALMEEAERNHAPDGTRVGCWTLRTTGPDKSRRWFYEGV